MAPMPCGHAFLIIIAAAWGGNPKKRGTIFKKPAIACHSRVFRFLANQQERNMKTKKTKLAAEFAPETRFELQPIPPASFRANLDNEFEQLKNQLLAEQLYLAKNAELYAPLRRAATEAAALAWATLFPLLVFPVLFEEKIEVLMRHAKRQRRILANSSEMIVA